MSGHSCDSSLVPRPHTLPSIPSIPPQHLLRQGAFAREPPTLELWEFSARSEFDEMERYCRQDLTVVRKIDSIISDPSKGVEYLLGANVSRFRACDGFAPSPGRSFG